MAAPGPAVNHHLITADVDPADMPTAPTPVVADPDATVAMDRAELADAETDAETDAGVVSTTAGAVPWRSNALRSAPAPTAFEATGFGATTDAAAMPPSPSSAADATAVLAAPPRRRTRPGARALGAIGVFALLVVAVVVAAYALAARDRDLTTQTSETPPTVAPEPVIDPNATVTSLTLPQTAPQRRAPVTTPAPPSSVGDEPATEPSVTTAAPSPPPAPTTKAPVPTTLPVTVAPPVTAPTAPSTTTPPTTAPPTTAPTASSLLPAAPAASP